MGEGGYPKVTQGAEHEDLAYNGLGDIAPPHSRAVSTTPSTRLVLCNLTGVVNNFISIYFIFRRLLSGDLTTWRGQSCSGREERVLTRNGGADGRRAKGSPICGLGMGAV